MFSRFLILSLFFAFSNSASAFACPPILVEALTSSSEGLVEFCDVSQNPEVFREQVLLTAQHPKHPDRVWIRDLVEYIAIVEAGGKLFLSVDNSGGFGVTHNHELISMFNNGSHKGLGKKMVTHAIGLGANHLYCWGEPLVRYYEQFGFAVKQTLTYRPEFWINDNPPADPKPSIYLMELESNPIQEDANLAHQQILSNLPQ